MMRLSSVKIKKKKAFFFFLINIGWIKCFQGSKSFASWGKEFTSEVGAVFAGSCNSPGFLQACTRSYAGRKGSGKY